MRGGGKKTKAREREKSWGWDFVRYAKAHVGGFPRKDRNLKAVGGKYLLDQSQCAGSSYVCSIAS